MSEFDAILVGAGHNSLACAAHLASKGWKTAVFERNAVIGGVATELVAESVLSARVSGRARVRTTYCDASGGADEALQGAERPVGVACEADAATLVSSTSKIVNLTLHRSISRGPVAGSPRRIDVSA